MFGLCDIKNIIYIHIFITKKIKIFNLIFFQDLRCLLKRDIQVQRIKLYRLFLFYINLMK